MNRDKREIKESCFNLFNAVQVIICITDFKGNILEVNKYFLEYLGYSKKEIKNINAQSFYVNSKNRNEIIKRLQDDGCVKNFKACLKKKDSTIKTVLINMEVIQYQGKQVILSIANDFTREKEAAEQLKNNENELKEKTKKLAERIKELNCLIDISRIVEKPGITLENILQGIVERMPAAWQYPEITCAQIIFGEQEYKTKNFMSTIWKQRNCIYVNNEQAGLVEVCYLEEKPKVLEGPFLLEERHLINAISEWLGKIIERFKIKEELVTAKNKAEKSSKIKSNFLANMSHVIMTPLTAILGFSEMLLIDENDENRINKLNIIKKSGEILKNIINDILDFSRIAAQKTKIEKSTFSLRNMITTIEDIILPKAKKKNLLLKTNAEGTIPEYVEGDNQKISQVILNILTNSIKFTETGEILFKYKYKDGILKIEISDTGIGISEEEQKIIFSPFEQTRNIHNYNNEGFGLGLTISKRLLELMNGTIKLESKMGQGSTFIIFIPLPEVPNLKIKNNIIRYAENEKKINDIVQNWINRGKEDTAFKLTLMEAIKLLPKEVDNLNNAFLNDELKKIKSISHGIKGMTGMLGMTEIFNPIVKIDKEVNKKILNKDTIKNLIEKIKRIIKSIPNKYFIAEKSILAEKNTKSIKSNILVVEDNVIIQELIKNYITELKLNCELASNGLAAVEMLKKNKYNFVLLDIQIPKMNGMELIKYIRKNEVFNNLYIIVMTGKVMKYIKQCLAEGCDDYLVKPFTIEQLKEKIQKYTLIRKNIN